MSAGQHIEAAHLDMQMAAQQVQNLTFFVMGHVGSYDPGSHRIKAIIPTFQNQGGQYMETGWIQLGTQWVGQGFGLQVAPYGGANVDDITGQNNATDDKPVNPEQIVLMIISQDNTLTIGGVLTFNSTDFPPGTGQPQADDYGNLKRIQLSSGEAIMRHSSGSYMLFRNDGSMTINANTSPQVPFQEPSMDTLERVSNFLANTNLDAGAPDATMLTATDNITAATGIAGKSDSVPSGGTLNSNINVLAAANGTNSTTGNSTIAITANGDNHTSQGLFNLQVINTGMDVDNEITMTAVAAGTSTSTAVGNFQATANMGTTTANMTVAATAVQGTATTTLAASGETATVNINSDGKVVITTPLTNVLSSTINCGTGTMKRVLTDICAQIYNNHTHSGVTTGGGSTGAVSRTMQSSDEAQNLNAS